MTDFDTDFAPLFEPPLQSVDVRTRLSVEAFGQYRAAQTPVIIRGLMDDWRALTSWADPAYLRGIAGAERVYYRNLSKGSADVSGYKEVYESTSFGEFIDKTFGGQDSGRYLTQATIIRPDNFRCCFERSRRPAYLAALASDVVNPPYFRDRDIYEANLWVGPGRQISGLHFDELDNLNCLVMGEKRWIMFPHSEHSMLITDRGVSGSIVRGFHAAEETRFADPKRRRAQGYQCVVGPGDVLYVPHGYWHQVFSGPSANMAVNYWYLPIADLFQILPLFARRYAGFHSRVRQGLAMLALVGVGLGQLARYASRRFRGQKILPPPVGPTEYLPRRL